MRLIDADALIPLIKMGECNMYDEYCQGRNGGIEFAVNKVKEMPTVEPERTGTHIKCKYSIAHCGIHCYWDEETPVRCGLETYQYCKHYRPPKGSKIFNDTCIHLAFKDGEFEDDVNSYSLQDGTFVTNLDVCEEVLQYDEIEYLEIDGRIIINTEDNT